jgi:hypothetical protein
MALLAIGLGASTGLAQSKTNLRWKFKPGETLAYSMEQTTVTSGPDLSGREMKRTIALTLDMTWTTKAVDGSGLASWTQTIDRVRITITSPGSKISSDSKEAVDGEGLFGPIFKILVGAEFDSKMNPRGELTEIKLSEKLLATLAATDNGGGPKGQFSEEGLKNMLMQMVIPLPESAVAVGESWERKLTIPTDVNGQTRPIEQIFTYKGPETGATSLDAIDYTTKMEPLKPDPRNPVVYKKEAASGRFDFDNAAGRIAKSHSTEIMEVAVTTQGKEILQKVETTRTLTLSKDKAP